MDEDKILSKEEKEALKSWSNIGSTGLTPATRFMPTEQKKILPMSQPIEVKTEWLFTDYQFSVIQLGHEAHEMEDKWNIYMDDNDTLHFHRSWTGFETFRFTFHKVSNSEYKVDSFFYEGNREIYKVENPTDVKSDLYEVMKFVLREAPYNVIGE